MDTPGGLERRILKRSSKADRPRRKIPVAYNNSRVKLFVRCSQAYSFRYDYPRLALGKRGELVPNRLSEGLKRGGWMHMLMEAHWRQLAGQGSGWQARHEELKAEFDGLFDEEKEYYGDLPTQCHSLMTRYLRYYQDDEEKFKIVRLPKGQPGVEFIVEVPLKPFGLKGIFKGQIDLLVRDLEYGGIWIRDAKWMKSIPSADERMMSPQNIMYAWALRHLGHDIRGFIYDYGRTKPPAEPYILKNGTVTTRKNIDTDYMTYIKAIKKAHGKRWKQAARTIYKPKLRELKAREVLWFDRQRIPLDGPRMDNGLREYLTAVAGIQDRGEPVRNYIYNCKFSCAYHDACVASFQGLDITNLMRTNFHVQPERYTIEEVN
jgi:hypothetical protein